MSTDVAALTPAELDQFIHQGFVRVDGAFSPDLAARARAILWRDTGCDPDDPSTWREPVIRLGNYTDEPFRLAVNTPVLHRAFDQLVGVGKWLPCGSVGTFPVRFPVDRAPGDDGFHIDASFDFENNPDFMSWRANVRSRGRALLMLLLFSDVGERDAPTRLRVGSHLSVARLLASAGEHGLTLRELAASDWGATEDCSEALAVGPAGTAYLCHPFVVHAAQRHTGTTPRFMAQPPLLHAGEPFALARDGSAPVEAAIRLALARS